MTARAGSDDELQAFCDRLVQWVNENEPLSVSDKEEAGIFLGLAVHRALEAGMSLESIVETCAALYRVAEAHKGRRVLS
jgi:hypothetical protein